MLPSFFGTRPRSLRRSASVAAASVGLLTLAACSGDSAGPTDPGSNNNPAGPTVTVTFTPCTGANSSPIVWVAYQDGVTGSWKQATKVGGSYEMKFASTKGGVAITEDYGSDGHGTDVSFGTIEELQATLNWGCSATTQATAQVNGLLAGQTAKVSFGYNAAYMYGPGDKSSTLTAYADAKSMMGVVGLGDSTLTKMVLRRNITSLSQAPVDFSSAEAFAPVPGSITFQGDAPVNISLWFQMSDARHQIMSNVKPKNGVTTVFGLPADKMQTGEVYEFYSYYNQQLLGNNLYANKSSHGYVSSLNNVTVPAIDNPGTIPTMAVKSTTGYVRMGYAWTAPANTKAFTMYVGGYTDDNSINTAYSIAYLGTTTVDLSTPNFSGAAGWNNAWAPRTGQTIGYSFNAETWSANVGGFYLSRVDGNIARRNGWNGTVTQ